MATDPSSEALKAAYLSAQEGKSQVEIAKHLGISQAKVSRLLKQVGDEYIQKTTRFRIERVRSIALQRELQGLIARPRISSGLDELAQANRQRGPTVHVTPGSDAGKSPDAVFAMGAAVIVRKLLQDVTGTIGVAWGNTLWELTQAIQQLSSQPLSPKPVGIVPLCGDPLMDQKADFADRTASRIASELNRAVNGDKHRPVWLGLVPAFIPRSFQGEAMKALKRYVAFVPQYRTVFGTKKGTGLANDLHVILTATGSAEHPVSFGKSILLGLSDREASLLTASIYGDVGGVLFPREKLERNALRLVGILSEHWTGLELKHLCDCATQAFDQTKPGVRPGVIVLSFGVDRADIVLEAVHRGVVNHLIVSQELEAALEARLPEWLKQVGRAKHVSDTKPRRSPLRHPRSAP